MWCLYVLRAAVVNIQLVLWFSLFSESVTLQMLPIYRFSIFKIKHYFTLTSVLYTRESTRLHIITTSSIESIESIEPVSTLCYRVKLTC